MTSVHRSQSLRAHVITPVLWSQSLPAHVITLYIGLSLYAFTYFKKCYSVLSDLGINGPKPKILFGNATDFKNRFPLDVFQEWTKQYGKVFGYYEGLRPSIVVSDPEIIKEILVKQFDKFYIRPLTQPFMYHPEDKSIIVTHGTQWKRERVFIGGAFKPNILMQMVPRLMQTAATLLDLLEERRQKSPDGFNLSECLKMYVLESLATAAFGYRSDCLTNSDNVLTRYTQASAVSASAHNSVTGLARLFPTLTPLLKVFDRHHRLSFQEYMKDITSHVTQQVRLIRDSNTKPSNILQHMILATSSCKDSEEKHVIEERMSEEAIVTQTSALIGGASAVTQALIQFLTHALMEHPGVQQKVYTEIQQHCQTEAIDYHDLSRLKYLDMVIKETLRHYTVAPGVARVCTEDCQISGFHFKKGITVRLMSSTINFEEEYFPQAQQFTPERFQTPSSYAWMPFGHGPRMCVGQRLGLLQVKAAIVKILQKFIIFPSKETEIPLVLALMPVLIPKNGIHVKLMPRST
ncbi:cytochrome P450 3A15-like [Gigantopelta aegis]|uniref:cytochrome P450 3A15-like n=1 Tax=Gigantopelta aegis TaxID=1735272 RepID=UPI001B88949A|nr:cytochrome P450 3A15-like [Gigantopelta aegis]